MMKTSEYSTASDSKAEQARKVLLSRILSGEYCTGLLLPSERELSQQLDISRSTLHQALVKLSEEGFVKIEPRLGITVCNYRKYPTPRSLEAVMSYGSAELDYELFRDMMDMRLWLETECVRLAAGSCSRQTIGELRGLLAEAKQPDADTVGLLFDFHYTLTLASGNSIYSMIFRAFEPCIRALTKQRYELSRESLPTAFALREELMDHLEAGNADAAVELLRRILSRSADILAESYPANRSL